MFNSIQPVFFCLFSTQSLLKSHYKIYQLTILTFVIKAIYSVDARTLVVAPQQKEIFWIFDFVRQEKADCFQRLFASVDVIA